MGERELVPLESLGLDGAKNLRKTEIGRYLQQHGIAPAATKPALKTQLRELMRALGIQKRPSAAPLIRPQLQPSQQQQQQQQQLSPAAEDAPTTSGGEQLHQSQLFVKCSDCARKANRECPYRRCRQCCLTAMKTQGYTCVAHLRSVGGGAASSSAANVAAAAAEPQAAEDPWPTGVHPFEPPLLFHPNIAARCPHCGVEVCALGAQPWIHMRECVGRDAWWAAPNLPQHATLTAVADAVARARRRKELSASVLSRVFGRQRSAPYDAEGARAARLEKTVDALETIVAAAPAFYVSKAQRASRERFAARLQALEDARGNAEQLSALHSEFVAEGVVPHPAQHRDQNAEIRALLSVPSTSMVSL